ncbi:Oidioi.mRNA.OKI2018_I69.PAR.g9212.t1.cds [Oikopleura dioica]|uniref:Oidioi.mRNA.OKI2018_I69.PAR.g9212.t1.cds n=1 Tax=Oikopleura dioica TaxID=34765 RepID=A0ABN7RNN3_OIKDI|nr:Oidioi.mRNA.OKI2018_I69.PAR.g9212.t1.cds [Oikopleura dioica]
MLFLLLPFFQVSFSKAITDTRVFDHEFPSYVQIVNQRRKGFCGGTILDSRHVLSAAHCNVTAGQIVHYGTASVGPESGDGFVTFVRKVSTIGQRLQESKIWSNDMAIIRVSPPFRFDNANVRPVKLGSKKEFDKYVEKGKIKCLLVGKGRVSTGDNIKYPKNLQKGYQIFDNTRTCEGYFKRETDLPNIPTSDGCFLTVGSDGSTGCKGDSGGPLFCFLPEKKIWKQFGIASFADKDCDKRTAWWAPFVAGKFISKASPFDRESCKVFTNRRSSQIVRDQNRNPNLRRTLSRQSFSRARRNLLDLAGQVLASPQRNQGRTTSQPVWRNPSTENNQDTYRNVSRSYSRRVNESIAEPPEDADDSVFEQSTVLEQTVLEPLPIIETNNHRIEIPQKFLPLKNTKKKQ